MPSNRNSSHRTEFGDFQTPPSLAVAVCSLLKRRGLEPKSVIEPTCGLGSFLVAAVEAFPSIERLVGLDVNSVYVKAAYSNISRTSFSGDISLIEGDFFTANWDHILESTKAPLLIIGNPPWVTNSELGGLNSSNLPRKENLRQQRGIDALTGASNFDISEWMLLSALQWAKEHKATLAVLCKTSVARKILLHAWKGNLAIKQSEVFHIDARKYFGVAVHACLLVIDAAQSSVSAECLEHQGFNEEVHSVFGYRDGCLVANVPLYERWKHLQGAERYKWRSGIKHDCSRVMELRKDEAGYWNGSGEFVDLETSYLYPMLKSAELSKQVLPTSKSWMLVTQRRIGEETASIEVRAPKTWSYLCRNSNILDSRGSRIYSNQPRFCVFGVGDYSFAPWKVAISGFYKKLVFKVVGPYEGKPVVFDDTCYFISCATAEEAQFLCSMLNSQPAQEFYSAFVFWDMKRPITVELLRRLDLLALAREIGCEETFGQIYQRLGFAQYPAEEVVEPVQLPLFFV